MKYFQNFLADLLLSDRDDAATVSADRRQYFACSATANEVTKSGNLAT